MASLIKKPITPNLWFDTIANMKTAVDHYVAVFPNSRITSSYTMHNTPSPEGGETVVISFELNGAPYTAFNGGNIFKFSEAISLAVACDTQEEIDYYWSKLSAVPASEQCGWCKDQWGLSWQMVPAYLEEVMRSGDQAKIDKLTQAFMPMKKLVIADLRKAVEG